MTRMSDPRSRPPVDLTGNPSEFRAGSPLARAVQAPRATVMIAGAVLLALLCATLVGCVIPPSLRVDEETDSPPVITSVSSDGTMLADPGPILPRESDNTPTPHCTPPPPT